MFLQTKIIRMRVRLQERNNMAEEVVVKQKAEKPEKKDFIFAVGRRRESVARVRFYTADTFTWKDQTGKRGDIIVNETPIASYFSGSVAEAGYLLPFKLTNTLGKFGISIRVVGGGKSGQLGASVHGISRVLAAYKAEFHTTLRKHGLLTRDARTRQRRKVGMGGKSRRRKQSPKR